MEKLIELLNEFDGTPTEWKQIGDKIYFDGLGGNSELHELVIISKYYGFIKWLVDNYKIDFDKVIKNNYWNMSCLSDGIYDHDSLSNEIKTKYLLMILSIQDNPIEFLVSIL